MKRVLSILLVLTMLTMALPTPTLAQGVSPVQPSPVPVPTPPSVPPYPGSNWGGWYPSYNYGYGGYGSYTTPTPPTTSGQWPTVTPAPVPTPNKTPYVGEIIQEQWFRGKPNPSVPLFFVAATTALTTAVSSEALGVIALFAGGTMVTYYIFSRAIPGVKGTWRTMEQLYAGVLHYYPLDAGMERLAQKSYAVVPREYPTEADVEHLTQKARYDAYAIFANTPNPTQCFFKTDRHGNTIIAVVKNGGINLTTFEISGNPVVAFQSHANSTIYRFDLESGFTHEVMKGLWQPLSPDDWRCVIANKGLIRAAIEALNRGANPPFALP